jgi:hypothetical protein
VDFRVGVDSPSDDLPELTLVEDKVPVQVTLLLAFAALLGKMSLSH